MSKDKAKIVVTGDISFNNLIFTVYPESTEGLNWHNQSNVKVWNKPGESMLLAEMIKMASTGEVISPEINNKEPGAIEKYLSCYTELNLFNETTLSKQKVYRVGRFLGFKATKSGKPELIMLKKDYENADVVVIDDENNGFNNEKEFWPKAILSEEKNPIVLYKMNNPIGTNKLWMHLNKFHIEKTVVIISADDLRAKGVNISKSLSWEKTALDFVWQLENNPGLSFLADCEHLVVTFGLEGAIYCNANKRKNASLFFLPYEFEGDFSRAELGSMYGLTSCFVAALAGSISNGLKRDNIEELVNRGIREGIIFTRKYFEYGMGKDTANLVFPNPLAFRYNSSDSIIMDHVQDVKIPRSLDSTLQSQWYILKEKSTASLADLAFDVVKNGEKKILRSIPIAKFGNLKVVDRTEIESYRSIKNLISEYIYTPNVSRPLSIAVFGTPGSGKSFGVTEIASSIMPDQIRKLNFNLSQFRTPEELIRAFNKISDSSLLGKIPFIVFDEFDSFFEGKLGWLKYFLAPMQDGVYRGEDTLHPIGKAIFVFAGGTSTTFNEFCGEEVIGDTDKKEFSRIFKEAKGPDFISRLRGYVNILGPNQSSEQDQLYIIRRAMLIRSLMSRKLPQLIHDGEAQIDNGIIRAMLKVPRFKHETRSMEAIIEMSMLNSAKKWEQSMLPPKEQLSLHVEEEQFYRYMMRDVIFSEKVTELAIDLRQKYNDKTKNPIENDDISIDWRYLDREVKEFYKTHVKSIPDCLLKIQCDVIYYDKVPAKVVFSEEEVDQIANCEYNRRAIQCIEDGGNGTICSVLIPFEDSEDEMKEEIYQMIRLWPDILANANFNVERLNQEE